uniref:Uncharacterized protein n=1 Tax=Caenorhabditis tropicalis TaxID=1561998 RepID=A0A1I7URK9_9PELO
MDNPIFPMYPQIYPYQAEREAKLADSVQQNGLEIAQMEGCIRDLNEDYAMLNSKNDALENNKEILTAERDRLQRKLEDAERIVQDNAARFPIWMDEMRAESVEEVIRGARNLKRDLTNDFNNRINSKQEQIKANIGIQAKYDKEIEELQPQVDRKYQEQRIATSELIESREEHSIEKEKNEKIRSQMKRKVCSGCGCGCYAEDIDDPVGAQHDIPSDSEEKEIPDFGNYNFRARLPKNAKTELNRMSPI